MTKLFKIDSIELAGYYDFEQLWHLLGDLDVGNQELQDEDIEYIEDTGLYRIWFEGKDTYGVINEKEFDYFLRHKFNRLPGEVYFDDKAKASFAIYLKGMRPLYAVYLEEIPCKTFKALDSLDYFITCGHREGVSEEVQNLINEKLLELNPKKAPIIRARRSLEVGTCELTGATGNISTFIIPL